MQSLCVANYAAWGVVLTTPASATRGVVTSIPRRSDSGDAER